MDTNIPMYADGSSHPLKEPCVRALEMIADGSLPTVTSVEVLQEILHRYFSLGRRAEGVVLARRVARLLSIVPVTLSDVLDAADLAARHQQLAARDLVHLAVMRNHGLDTILSADAHFDAVPGITRLAPESFR